MRDVEDRPVVRRYRDADRTRIAMPVGGIGTGCIGFGGRGQLLDWELFNRPAKGFTPDGFFCLRVEDASGVRARVLEAALLPEEFEGHGGSPSALHGLPRFRHGEFAAAYPFGQVHLSDPQLPVEATVQAYNPLVPGDADASGVPAFVYRARIRNTADTPVSVSLCGSLQNVVGHRAPAGVPAGNRFEHVLLDGADVLAGHSTQVARDDEAWGTMARCVGLDGMDRAAAPAGPPTAIVAGAAVCLVEDAAPGVA